MSLIALFLALAYSSFVKKILVLILVLFWLLLGYSLVVPNLFDENQVTQEFVSRPKKPILRVALVADSHNENELLAGALKQAQGKGINFVIGLGDYTNLGTIEELNAAKAKFDESQLQYFVTAGDRDGWESRNRGVGNFAEVFGEATQVFQRNDVQFVILDNSDIYKGISPEDWSLLEEVTKVTNVSKTFETSETFETSDTSKLTFVFAHKTPFHPQSKHVMGEGSAQVAEQAKRLIAIMEGTNEPKEPNRQEAEGPEPLDFTRGKLRRRVDGFFSGDLHFFAQFNSPGQSVKITTIGAVARERNFQGPRFAILTVWDDYSWEVDEVEIR